MCDKDHQIVLVRSHRESYFDHGMLEKIADSGTVLSRN
jgi:hypothetical protein